jgi:hypothetical protein
VGATKPYFFAGVEDDVRVPGREIDVCVVEAVLLFDDVVLDDVVFDEVVFIVEDVALDDDDLVVVLFEDEEMVVFLEDDVVDVLVDEIDSFVVEEVVELDVLEVAVEDEEMEDENNSLANTYPSEFVKFSDGPVG